MAVHRDQNPFSHDDDINPFANHHNNHRVSPSTGLSTLDPEPALVYGHGGTAAPHKSVDTPAKLKKKQKELEAKEAELNKREEILKRKEEAVAKSGAAGIRVKNWPPFYPLVHHNIADDIPIHLQRIQYVAYAILLGVPVSLSWNFILSIAIYSSGIEGRYVFFSAIYLLLGPPGAFYFWYRPLYRANRTDNGTSFGCFFFNFFYHIVFFTFAAIGPRLLFSGLHFAGILNAISLMSKHPALGIMSFIGFVLFSIEAIVSIWVFQQVYQNFRGRGKSATIQIDL